MTFSGEFASDQTEDTSAPTSPKFCSLCGRSLLPEAKFCPGCGTPLQRSSGFASKSHSQNLVMKTDFTEGGKLTVAAAKKFAETVVSALFADFTTDERTLLLAFLSNDFTGAAVNSLVDGRTSTSSSAINLANMQGLHEAVVSQRSLSAGEVELAELALRESPMCFGYWGALKALLKYHPESVSKEAIGSGFARISGSGSINNFWWNGEGKFENIRLLSSLHHTPTAKTRYYLSRRGRRNLVRLANTKAEDYLSMCAGFLLTADRDPSSTDFMFGHIVYGGGRYLNARSRAVNGMLGASALEPYRPELWKNGSTELNKLWLGVTNSRVIQDFTFTLAAAHKIRLLPLQGRSVNLALQSEISELRKIVIDQLASSPDCWGELDEDGWRMFVSEVDEKALPSIRASIGTLEYTHSLANAIEAVFEEIDDPHSVRMQQLAAIYFTVKPEREYWSDNSEVEGRAAAALLISGISLDIPDFQLLTDRLGFEGTLICWSSMQRNGGVSVETNADLLAAAITYWANFNSHERQSCFYEMATLAPDWYADLGSSLIARDYDFDLVLKFIDHCHELTDSTASITGALVALLRVTPQKDVDRVLREALSNDDLAGTISLGDLLNQSGQARSLAWSELADDEDSEIGSALQLNKQMLIATMLELLQTDIANARGRQVSLLTTFFNATKTQDQIPGPFLIGAASNASEELASLGNKLLKKRGILGQNWLALAETQMPLAIGFAREYVRSLSQAELSSAVLLGTDSPVAAVRDMALDLLDTMREKIDVAFVYSRLAESRDPVIRSRVAEEALLSPWSDGEDLVSFDSELLVTLRRTRKARENIKARIDTLVTQPADSRMLPDERISALISLTRIGNSRDREWALARLAQLKMAGVDINGVTVSLIVGGSQNV